VWRRMAWTAFLTGSLIGTALIRGGYASDRKGTLDLSFRHEGGMPFISIEQNEDRSTVGLVCIISIEYADNQPSADFSVSLGMELAFWNSDGFGAPLNRSVWQEKLTEKRGKLCRHMLIAGGISPKRAHYHRAKGFWVERDAAWQQRLNHKLTLQRTNFLSDGFSSVMEGANKFDMGAIRVESERFDDLDNVIHRYPGTRLTPQFNDLGFELAGGSLGLLEASPTEHGGSYSATNGEAGKPRRNAPIETLCTFVAAILGVPLFFAGLFREKVWMYFFGLVFGAGGLGWFLADWLSGTSVFP
jgi:hypothetical protein